MAAGRSHKGLARRRERGGDDDDDGQLLVGDSQSEGSAVTGADSLDQSASESEMPDTTPRAVAKKTQPAQNHPGKKSGKNRKQGAKSSGEDQSNGLDTIQPPAFKVNADTEAMMRGLSLADKPQDAVDFETTSREQQTMSKTGASNGEQPGKQRREHEEYKKKRDSDPAFIPNRGNFFMHDTRGQSNGGPTPFRGGGGGGGRGGRGRSGFDVNSGSYAGAARGERASEQVWKHDLHAAINEEPTAGAATTSEDAAGNGVRPQRQPDKQSTGPVSFSSTQRLGRIQLRVMLPGMSKPITYSEVPATKYVRLPDHRPPLRRDKPIRIFLPNIGPRYIFPSTERSFIFIPRQMRPNQRGFGNTQQRSIGGYGYSSRRTSMYGGSMYSASVAASRRSSITRDRESMFSPASYASGYQPPHRPVVRLPHNGQYFPPSTPPILPYSGQHTPAGQIHTYPLPQQPAFQGTPTTTVQHPRPQKAISVSGIESPAMLHQHQSSTDQQAFHGQLPMHLASHSSNPSQGSITHFEYPQPPFAYATGPAAASPLSRIPENAMHANSFQPPQQMYYPPYAGGQQPFYYPPMQMQMPVYAMSAPQPDTSTMAGPASQPAQSHPRPPQNDFASQSSQGGTGMVAHESNGMVFYMPATEAAAQSNTSEQYQPAEGFVPTYAAAGMPTNAQDRGMYYYMGMPGVSSSMNYYPTGQQS